MKIFLSYGDVNDQLLALRLQALGAANGLTLYVPPTHTRRGTSVADPQVMQKLIDAGGVLGLVSSGLSEACSRELNAALAASKNLIAMASAQFHGALQASFQDQLVLMDASHPEESERAIVQRFRQNDGGNALIGLGTLVLGLMLLAPAE